MLINCVAYHHGKKLADIPIEDISIWVEKPECFVWVALRDATHAELQLMQEEFGLHELAVEDARNGHQRPKIEEYGGIVFIVMQLLEVQQDQVQVGEVAIFVGTNFVLSVRNSSQQNFLGVRGRCEREPDLLQHGAGFVCYALMDAVVDRYFPLLDAIETELDDIETRIFDRNAARGNIERLYALKRRATTMRHAVSPLLEVTGKLHGGRVPVAFSGTQEYFRDVHDHLMRINSTIDSIRETIATAIQVNLSMVTIEESETTKKLAAWAAIFGVSTSLAGVWGMNFERMPELKWEYGYPVALLIIFSAIGVLYWRFRRIGWL
ncbi:MULTISPECIES: magnesium and cobalt transport protein CorA [Giesbergeria]|uniref:Magnesium and cobalt transport protein CorA n=1 Tax=Giesbergeria sinuosa TaxID=80883 RepID=A0ABV9QF37_9BURK